MLSASVEQVRYVCSHGCSKNKVSTYKFIFSHPAGMETDSQSFFCPTRAGGDAVLCLRIQLPSGFEFAFDRRQETITSLSHAGCFCFLCMHTPGRTHSAGSTPRGHKAEYLE